MPGISGETTVTPGGGISQAAADARYLTPATAASTYVPLTSRMLAVTTAQFDKTTSTALANVPGLSLTLVAGGTYDVEAIMYLAPDGTGGGQIGFGGTATATAMIGYTLGIIDPSAPQLNGGSFTSLAGSAVSVDISVYVRSTATITVNAGGTLTVQFAQASASGTSSVLVGAILKATRVS